MSIKKRGTELVAELLIGFPFLPLHSLCRISHDRGIKKKNLYNDNDIELVRQDQSFLFLEYDQHYFLFLLIISKKKTMSAEANCIHI